MRKLALAALLAVSPCLAVAAGFEVPLDQAVRISLPAPAMDVIVGNPAIADVAVSDQRHLIVTGKTFGVTNLIVIGPRGRTLLERQVLVGGSAGSHVSMVQGAQEINYTCAPTCEPSAGGGGGGGGAAAATVAAPPPPSGGVTASPNTP